MADQSVARKTRFEKLDMFSVSSPGPLKIFDSNGWENTPKALKKSMFFK